MSSIFGGGKTVQTSTPGSVPITRQKPRDIKLTSRGGGLTVQGDTGRVFAPNSDFFRNQTISTLGKAKASRDRIGNTINDLKSNNNAFINARVRPTEEAVAQRIGGVTRDLGRRGVAGSLANNEIMNATFAGQREINDQRAIATNESIEALLRAEGEFRGANDDALTHAGALLQDTITSMGLGLQALQISLGDQLQTSQIAGGTVTNKEPTDVLGGIAKLGGLFF